MYSSVNHGLAFSSLAVCSVRASAADVGNVCSRPRGSVGRHDAAGDAVSLRGVRRRVGASVGLCGSVVCVCVYECVGVGVNVWVCV